jgi:four helix bundle protein
MRRRDLSERSFRLAVDVVQLCKELRQREYEVAGVLVGQLMRAATSIGANLEEARGAQSRPDLISKCSIACKEARETLYWLRLIQATTAHQPAALAALIVDVNALVAILIRCINLLKKGG